MQDSNLVREFSLFALAGFVAPLFVSQTAGGTRMGWLPAIIISAISGLASGGARLAALHRKTRHPDARRQPPPRV